MGEKLDSMNNQCQYVANENSSLKNETFDLRRKLDETQNNLLNSSSEYENKKALINSLIKEKDNLLAQLSKLENANQQLKESNNEMQDKLGHSSKVRSMVEEQFSSEITALHQQNSELKISLNSAQQTKHDLQKRIEHIQELFSQTNERYEQQNDILLKLQREFTTLQREHDLTKMQKNNAETELQDKISTISRLETEIQKIKRGDLSFRKNTEENEHLQAKVDQLNALNHYLKEQADLKERQVRDLEERLRRQEEEMKRVFSEVEVKSTKLKKREAFINQALKRLEAINYVKIGSPTKSGDYKSTNKENDDLKHLEF